MASLNDKVLEAGSIRKKFATDISLAVEKRVVDISLQNPDHGARRLIGLLAGEGILIRGHGPKRSGHNEPRPGN
jgi:hypothetical protein